MSASFTLDINPARIVFGQNAGDVLAGEIGRLGCSRPMLLTTSSRREVAQEMAAGLEKQGEHFSPAIFAGAAMHTPVNVTQRALETFKKAGADCLVAIGGGSSIGLGKAIAFRNEAPQIAIPTTYSGSEVTSILGQTENGGKTTLRSPSVLPETVIYDPALSRDLPLAVSIASGMNAIAHGVEALYSADRNPLSSKMAVGGIRAMTEALPALRRSLRNEAARSTALYGAWLCGTVLGTVGMSLHHKLCHVLGGSFNLPHAETHAILIPHVLRYNEAAAADALAPLAQFYGTDLGNGLWDFARSIGAPTKLRDLGLQESDLDRVVAIACESSYPNPRDLEPGAMRAMLQRAFDGTPPGG